MELEGLLLTLFKTNDEEDLEPIRICNAGGVSFAWIMALFLR